MTERLYYEDSYLTRFQARVVEAGEDGRRIYLDRSAFYPDSGGQPHDLGTLNGIRIVEVIDEEERIAHRLEEPLASVEVAGEVDWKRRFDHMQQHSGQHLLSAVLAELFGFKTVSFHLGSEISTIDLETASIGPGQLTRAEVRANELVFENRPFTVEYRDAAEAGGLRKASDRAGTLRIVGIGDLDRSACGGTHVRASGEIGPLLLRKTEKIRGNVRLEFLCGGRAIARTRADYDALTRIAQVFSSAIDAAPELVAAQQSRLQDAEKSRRKLAAELAVRRGRDLYAACETAPSGLRIHQVSMAGGIDDEVRNEANGFVSGERAAFVGLGGTPVAVLLAVSADCGIHAGNLLKGLLQELGGRGGGTALLAQGSLPDSSPADRLRDAIFAAIR